MFIPLLMCLSTRWKHIVMIMVNDNAVQSNARFVDDDENEA